MGKKRIIRKTGEEGIVSSESGRTVGAPHEATAPRGKVSHGIAHIQATYNNTIITVTDENGNALGWSSAGALGFSGTKKATPYAAARVSETVAEKVRKFGLQDITVRVSGVGSGRDSAIRALGNHGLNVIGVKDVTPSPHNGPRRPKVRRV